MTLSLDRAMQLVHAAIDAGREKGMPIAVVVVDSGGRILSSARTEECGFLNLDVAVRKAVTAANFKASTQALLDMIKADSFLVDAVMKEPELTLIPGGFPILSSGTLIGAVGIAGGHYSQDQLIGEQILKS